MQHPMELQDYYTILGVALEADKKANQLTFHQLARKYHPDVNPGNVKAEETFKAISEAYQVLSDVQQRQEYDALRVQCRPRQNETGNALPNFGAQYRPPPTADTGGHFCDVLI